MLRNYGIRLFTTRGSRQSLAYCSGIPSSASVPDCYAEDGFRTVSTNPCGEIPLCPYDSCRLLALNLLSYVDEPFTKAAKFNFEKFKEHVAMAMHLMDDIIDLELEKVELIINKIASDPEDDDVRRVELELWKKIKDMALKGRRTGLGITAEGDMLAASVYVTVRRRLSTLQLPCIRPSLWRLTVHL